MTVTETKLRLSCERFQDFIDITRGVAYNRLHNWRCTMGRINAGILSATFVALLVITTPSLAQENEHKEKSTPKTCYATGTKEKGGIWAKCADGVWEAHIPSFVDDEEGKQKPEFAAVRLTAARYAEFQKGSKTFSITTTFF
jgi:hypothetical protein